LLFATVHYCMPPDDGRMTETCSGNNVRRGGEELLRGRTINCLMSAELCLQEQTKTMTSLVERAWLRPMFEPKNSFQAKARTTRPRHPVMFSIADNSKNKELWISEMRMIWN
jgi:hypothetical protein